MTLIALLLINFYYVQLFVIPFTYQLNADMTHLLVALHHCIVLFCTHYQIPKYQQHFGNSQFPFTHEHMVTVATNDYCQEILSPCIGLYERDVVSW